MAKKKPTEARDRLTDEQKREFAEAVFEARSIVNLCVFKIENDDGDIGDADYALSRVSERLDTVCALMDKAGIS